MHRMLCIPLAVIAALLSSTSVAESEQVDSNDISIGELEWLAGSWSGRQGDTVTEEHWIEPKGGLMLGVNRSVRGTGKAAFEFLRIAETDGTIVYHASPGGRAATPFTLIKASNRQAVFQNLENDFPQRIIYRRQGDTLTVRIDGTIKDEKRKMEWKWTRQAAAR